MYMFNEGCCFLIGLKGPDSTGPRSLELLQVK